MPAVAATPTRNTTVPAANKKPMNRTSKRIIEYPFQPLRHNKALPLRNVLPIRPYVSYVGRKGILIDSEDLAVVFYRIAAVAKLGLPPSDRFRFQFAGPAVARRLAKKASIACAIDPTVRERQFSDTRCSRSPLFET